jgi:hypothetical protein
MAGAPKIQQFQNAYLTGHQDNSVSGISPQEMAAYYQNASNTKNIINSRRIGHQGARMPKV